MDKTSFFIALVLLAVQITAEEDGSGKVVKTTSGLVRGYKIEGWDVYGFFGIPYATAPTGPHKFKAPLPAPAWLNTLEAVDKSIICPQYIMKEHPMYNPDQKMQENCLVANVYVPNTEEKKLPVIVYIHGGAYQLGEGNLLTPKGLVQKGNVIAVNFNYRLGVHGFLCLGTEDVPGNAGMKDQVALLRWVKKNIASFGGNPDDVTIAGFSAGASAVELIALSDSARGLFNKVIPESGAGIGVWSIQRDPLENAKILARILNYTSDDIYELEEFYKTTPLDILNYDNYLKTLDSSFHFVPCVERETSAEEFLKDDPLTILRKRDFRKLPVLVGFANMEGIFRLDVFAEWKDRMNKKFSDFLPADLQFESDNQKEEIANQIKKFYFGDKPVSEDTIQGYIDYFSDVLFTYATLRSVRLQVEAGNKNIYLYEYGFTDEPAIQKLNPYSVKGANHMAQSVAVQEFEAFFKDYSAFSESYKSMRETIKQLWINFIKTGKPVPEPWSVFPEGWAPSSAEGSPHMALDVRCTLRGALLPERTRFWDEIYEQYYRPPTPPPKPYDRHTEL